MEKARVRFTLYVKIGNKFVNNGIIRNRSVNMSMCWEIIAYVLHSSSGFYYKWTQCSSTRELSKLFLKSSIEGEGTTSSEREFHRWHTMKNCFGYVGDCDRAPTCICVLEDALSIRLSVIRAFIRWCSKWYVYTQKACMFVTPETEVAWWYAWCTFILELAYLMIINSEFIRIGISIHVSIHQLILRTRYVTCSNIYQVCIN